MAVLVKCRIEGKIVLVAVPYKDFQCDYGAIIGPPDLVDMGLSADKVDQLREALIDLGLFQAPDLMGKRGAIKTLFDQLGVSRDHVNTLIHSYQIDYYEQEERKKDGR